MTSWYEAPSLGRLKQAVDTRWPGRDHSSDGSIGDAAHQARTSDHNPDPKTGVVRARDLDKDGLHVPTVLAAMFLHPGVRYVIHAGKIFHVDNRFKPKKYTGSNPHFEHIHVSLEHMVQAENSKAAWVPISSGFFWPTLRLGHMGIYVRQLQAYLNGHGAALAVDGDFGAGTDAALRSFQRSKKIRVDGLAGPETLKTLRTA